MHRKPTWLVDVSTRLCSARCRPVASAVTRRARMRAALDELPWNPDVGRIATCGRNRWRSDAGVGVRLAKHSPCDARPAYHGRLLTFWGDTKWIPATKRHQEKP